MLWTIIWLRGTVFIWENFLTTFLMKSFHVEDLSISTFLVWVADIFIAIIALFGNGSYFQLLIFFFGEIISCRKVRHICNMGIIFSMSVTKQKNCLFLK